MKRTKFHDHYFHKAKHQKYSARSVYKLKDIQEKYNLIGPKSCVLDLGAAPGSWTEYIASLLQEGGLLYALDERPLSKAALDRVQKSAAQFTFLQQSVFDPLPDNLPVFDAIVSDMAPFTQGNKLVDTAGSLALIIRGFEIGKKHLKQGGHFLVKLFQSEDTMKAAKAWGRDFEFSKIYRPPAVQKESKETYFIGRGYK